MERTEDMKENQQAEAQRHGREWHRAGLKRGRDQTRKDPVIHKSEGHHLDGMCIFRKILLAALWFQKSPGKVVDER